MKILLKTVFGHLCTYKSLSFKIIIKLNGLYDVIHHLFDSTDKLKIVVHSSC